MTNRVTNAQLQESVQRLEAIVEQLQENVAKIQESVERGPNEEKIRALMRQEAHGVVTRDMEEYERRFNNRDETLMARFEKLASEMQQATENTVLTASRIADDNKEIRDFLRDLEANIKRDMREMFGAYAQTANDNNERLKALERENDESENTTRRIAQELTLITGVDILNESPTRPMPSMLMRTEKNEEDVRILQADVNLIQHELKVGFDNIKNKHEEMIKRLDQPSELVIAWRKQVPAPVRKTLAEHGFKIIVTLLTGGGFTGLASIFMNSQ